MPGASEHTRKVTYFNANWVAGPEGTDGRFEVLIVTDDGQQHVLAPSLAPLGAAPPRPFGRAGKPRRGALGAHPAAWEHGELAVELDETQVAAEALDHLAQIARLL